MIDSNDVFTCHVCGDAGLEVFPSYAQLVRVGSDCSPFRSGGKLGTCPRCRCTQNSIDEQWHAEVREIYGSYAIYQQSADNSEQTIFDDTGAAAPRSLRVLRRASEFVDFTGKGKSLDFGCGNGALLKTLSKLAPSWSMTGFELSDKHRKEVESIERVVSFQSGDLDRIDGCFDLVTMHHVLEHLHDPLYWLVKIRQKLLPDGFLLVEVPDAAQNPFDLIVADHCTHFTLSTLHQVIERAGYELIVATNDWVGRELSVLARPSKASLVGSSKIVTGADGYSAGHALQWLEETAQCAMESARRRPFGVFGSAIAATWLYSTLDGRVDFFVDEDVNRIGQHHLHKAIISTKEVPPGSHVFIGLSSSLCGSVKERLSVMPFHVYTPLRYTADFQASANSGLGQVLA